MIFFFLKSHEFFFELLPDNIRGLTAVIGNGSVVNLSDTFCEIDSLPYPAATCQGLWFSLRGAGSSFALVTTLAIQMHRLPEQFKANFYVFFSFLFFFSYLLLNP
jgi:hypothetical protein